MSCSWLWPWQCPQTVVAMLSLQPGRQKSLQQSRCERPPTWEAAFFEAGKSRTLVPSRKQGYNYHNTQLAGDLPFLRPALLPSLAPAQVLTDWAVSQTDHNGEQPTHTPFESVLNLFLLHCFCWHKSASPGGLWTPPPPQQEAHSSQAESESLRCRIYASSPGPPMASIPVCFWRLEQNLPAPCQVCHHHPSHRSRLLKAIGS